MARKKPSYNDGADAQIAANRKANHRQGEVAATVPGNLSDPADSSVYGERAGGYDPLRKSPAAKRPESQPLDAHVASAERGR